MRTGDQLVKDLSLRYQRLTESRCLCTCSAWTGTHTEYMLEICLFRRSPGNTAEALRSRTVGTPFQTANNKQKQEAI